MHRRPIVTVALLLTLACSSPQPPQTVPQAAPPEQNAFPSEKTDAIDAAIERAIGAGRLPGAVFRLQQGGRIYQKSYGLRALVPGPEKMTHDTVFDAASITKVAATTPAVWMLIERGKVGLDDHVSKWIPEFSGGWRDEITIRQLLTHTSGLRPDVDLDKPWQGADTGIRLAIAEVPRNRPGYVFRYSDINFLLLGEIVQRASGLPLDQFAAREIYQPLGMRDTRFLHCVPSEGAGSPCTPNPPIGESLLHRVAPTEQTPAAMLRGVVHDPTARRMGGVAGHAGLFTTVEDLSRYARMLLGGGELDGVRVLKPQTVKIMTSVLSPPGVAVRRAGGFDVDSGYSRPRGDIFPIGSFGHTGFTGGFFWVDPWSQTYYVFLSSRLHPHGRGNVVALQRSLGNLAADAAGLGHAASAGDANPCHPPPESTRVGLAPRCPRLDRVTGGADVMNGIDVLHASRYRALEGLRIGLITNHSGIDRAGNPTIDLLRSAPGVQLAALFSPEHGIRGIADEKIGDTVDPVSGLAIFSLYGERRAPTPGQLADLDALVFDIQDIGTRFYTYISTLGMAMEAAAAAGKKFFVLDRVNAIGGDLVEGPIAQGPATFVAYHPIPVCHGLTVGELAKLYKAEKDLPVDLHVIGLRGWRRDMWQDEAGLPWIDTSPNMRTLTAAGLYPGLGLLESALSVGRGTPTPFEIIGAPYIDAEALARALTDLRLPGVAFEPVRFTPAASTFRGQPCGGVRIRLTDRRVARPVRTGIAIATTLRGMYGDSFDVDKMAHLLKHPPVLEAVRAARPEAEIVALWKPDEAAFQERRSKVLMY